ncbi:MAG: DUF4410 domain-containing protein [Proteobacteria bacterium]|nr:DUF4410 domain-containing protein [Pseudomonadota bacterium]
MKPITLLVSMFLLLGLITGGCGEKKAQLNPLGVKDIAVLTMDGNLPKQKAKQARELRTALEWMDRDLVKNLSDSGFAAILVKDRQAYKPEMGKLMIVDVERFKASNRSARAFVGFGAGSASLALSYKLLDEKGILLSEWRDGVSSSKGAIDCAEILNRKALENVIDLFTN